MPTGIVYSLILFLVLPAQISLTDTSTNRINHFEDLIGLRVDTASAIKDFDRGLIIIKANTNVTVRFFGVRLQDLKTVRITKSVQSCAIGDSIVNIGGDSIIEMSPPTASINVRFPDYSTTYYFCFEFRNGLNGLRARADPTGLNITELTISHSDSKMRVERDAGNVFLHQGTAPWRSIATAQRSWFG